MAHHTALFNNFGELDRAQAPYAFNDLAAYNAYTASNSHYSGVAASSFNSGWGLSATTPGAAHRSQLNSPDTSFYPQSTPRSEPLYTRGYQSYPSPPYTPNEPSSPRPRPNYNATHHHNSINSRMRTEQDIIHSMLAPISAEISRSISQNTASANALGLERVSWERSGPQGGLANTMQSVNGDVIPEPFQWSPHSDNQFLNFDTRSWSDALSSPSDASSYISSPVYTFPQEVSPVSSPPHRSSHSLDMGRQVSPASSSSSRSSVDNSNPNGKECSHCHATSTPLWRREPTTLKPLCNACGLYLQQRNKHRPQELIDADAADDSSDASDGDTNGPECSHCRTHHTSVWRRSKTGAQLCNACGVYVRLRGRDRPLSLKRNKIKPRSKHTPRKE